MTSHTVSQASVRAAIDLLNRTPDRDLERLETDGRMGVLPLASGVLRSGPGARATVRDLLVMHAESFTAPAIAESPEAQRDLSFWREMADLIRVK
jgi:hypothetical protein